MQNARFSAKTIRATFTVLFTLFCFYFTAGTARAVDFDDHPAAADLVSELTTEYGLDSDWVEAIVRDAVYTESIIKAITRPAEKFPWHRYRPIFVTDSNAEVGVKFWKSNREVLERAESTYGVDASIIVAIIGVETRYGKITGRHRVIDSLVTLVLGYPKRKKFFQKELAEFIMLVEEEGLNLFEVRGSYAGAMGIPQFISSSYRHYAVDFNQNQQRNLLTETADAIGSVANYLSEHGWRRDEKIFSTLVPKNAESTELKPTKGLKTDRTFGDISDSFSLHDQPASVKSDTKIGVVKLETKAGQFEYRAAFHNFYVITTYNRSNLYGMAVSELAALISSKYSKQ